MLPNQSRRVNGEEQAAAPAGGSVMAPLIDKVGVPLLWFGIGYLAATLMQKPRRSP